MHDEAHSPTIHFFCHSFIAAYFRCKICRLQLSLVTHFGNDPHVNQFGFVVSIDENVLHFEILVDELESGAVEVFKGADQLPNELAHQRSRHYLACPRVLIDQSAHIVTDGLNCLKSSQWHTFSVGAITKHLNDVWMLANLAEQADFVQDPPLTTSPSDDDSHLLITFVRARKDIFVCTSADGRTFGVIGKATDSGASSRRCTTCCTTHGHE
mmetsp:Transcript_16557/g.29425  ORF Transcript_16557/g.29425 Transcript_16557/m.29425 type:complete len:212 (-) Transcript_16557:82-717(-)